MDSTKLLALIFDRVALMTTIVMASKANGNTTTMSLFIVLLTIPYFVWTIWETMSKKQEGK